MPLNDAQLGAALRRGQARVAKHAQETGSDLGTAAQSLRHVDRQAAAERELIQYAAQLQPQHVQYLAQLHASGGGEAVLAALQSTGLSRDALGVAAATYDQAGGFDGLVSTVQAEINEQVQRGTVARMQESQDRHSPQRGDTPLTAAVKRNSPLASWMRDPNIQSQAAALVAKLGLPVRPGDSPLETFLWVAREVSDGSFYNSSRKPGDPKIDGPTAIAELASMLGEKPADLAALLHEVDVAGVGHELSVRLAKHDHSPEAVKRRAELEPTKETRTEMAAKDRRRSAMEAAYDRAETENEARQERHPGSRERQLSPPHDAAESGEAAPSSASPYESSRHEALSDAYDAIDSAPEETNE
jgi:hypothetical protein